MSGLEQGLDFSDSLRSRCFEPDAPNLTPRISAMLCLGGDYRYDMSILKSIDEDGSDCARYTYAYPAKRGLGHFIHTYVTDGDPLPTFQGEPERVRIPNGIDAFTDDIWIYRPRKRRKERPPDKQKQVKTPLAANITPRAAKAFSGRHRVCRATSIY